MNDEKNPIYISKACTKSLWNEYRIYQNRLKLQGRFYLKTFVIPYDELISIDIFKPPVLRWALKLDWAELFEHVGITRRKGWMEQIRFTPREPREFVSKVKEHLS